MTPTIARLSVLPDDGMPPFRAGQYFALGLEVDGQFVQRPYSTASRPGAGSLLEFLVRLLPEGALTPHLWRIRPGARIGLGRPKGLFRLGESDPRRHVFLATGTGIAPFMAMLDGLLEGDGGRDGTGAAPPVLVHGVARSAELAYRERLASLSDRGRIVYAPAVSRPLDPGNVGWQGRTGRLDHVVPAVAGELGLDPQATVVYVCGNPAMIAAVAPVLSGLGIPPQAIRCEQYWTPSPAGSLAETAVGR